MKKLSLVLSISVFFLSAPAFAAPDFGNDYGAQDDYYGQQDDIYGYADDTYGRNDDLYGTIDSAYGAIDDLYGYIDDQEGKLDGLPNRKDPDIQAEIERAQRGIQSIQGFIDISYARAESFAKQIAKAGAKLNVLQYIMAAIDQEIASLNANVENVLSTFDFGTVYDVTGSVDLIYARVSDSYGLISDLWGIADDLVGALDGIPGHSHSGIEGIITEVKKTIQKIEANIQAEYPLPKEYYKKISDAWSDEDELYRLRDEIEKEAERFYNKNESLTESMRQKAQRVIKETEEDPFAEGPKNPDVPPSQPITPPPSDSACTMIYKPVCGKSKTICAAANTHLCDPESGKIKTYVNRCLLEKYRAEYLYEGECVPQDKEEEPRNENKDEEHEDNEKPGIPELPEVPDVPEDADEINCPFVYEPVCGRKVYGCSRANCRPAFHTKTYQNTCELEKDKASFMYKGECLPEHLEEEESKNPVDEEVDYYEDAEDGTIDKWFQYPPDKSGIPQSIIENIYNGEIQSRVISYESFGKPIWLNKEDDNPEKPADPVVGMKVKTEKTKVINLQYGIQTNSNLEGIARVASIDYKITPDMHNGEWTSVEYNLKQDLRKQDLELFGLEDEREILSVFTLKIYITDTQAEENEGLALFDDIKL